MQPRVRRGQQPKNITDNPFCNAWWLFKLFYLDEEYLLLSLLLMICHNVVWEVVLFSTLIKTPQQADEGDECQFRVSYITFKVLDHESWVLPDDDEEERYHLTAQKHQEEKDSMSTWELISNLPLVKTPRYIYNLHQNTLLFCIREQAVILVTRWRISNQLKSSMCLVPVVQARWDYWQ